MSFRRYTADQLRRLLEGIDAQLNQRCEIIVIGGAAALLAYKATRLTHDIDVLNDIDEVEEAYEKAKEKTGLDIPLSKAAVADYPYDFDQRLKKYTEVSLKNLIVRALQQN